MKPVQMLGLNPTDEERTGYRITELETRVRELEHLVHALLKGRANQELVDAWLDVTGGQKNTFTPSIHAIEGKGKVIASMMDKQAD